MVGTPIVKIHLYCDSAPLKRRLDFVDFLKWGLPCLNYGQWTFFPSDMKFNEEDVEIHEMNWYEISFL